MKRMSAGAVCAFGAAAVLLCGAARSEVVGGLVTGGTSGGVFAEITAPAVVGADAFESPDLIAFDERQDFVLPAPLPIAPGEVLGVGSIVSSHYVAFDPDSPNTLTGFVDFDEPIIGLVFAPGPLDGTSTLFGVPGTTYTTAPAIGPDMMDTFLVAPGMPNRLLVQYGASSPGDQLRVLTGVVLPEPTSVLLGGLSVIGFAVRRAL